MYDKTIKEKRQIEELNPSLPNRVRMTPEEIDDNWNSHGVRLGEWRVWREGMRFCPFPLSLVAYAPAPDKSDEEAGGENGPIVREVEAPRKPKWRGIGPEDTTRYF